MKVIDGIPLMGSRNYKILIHDHDPYIILLNKTKAKLQSDFKIMQDIS